MRKDNVGRNSYFSQLISKQGHNPRILFKTSQPVESSPERCEEFLNYFYNKIVDILQHISTELSEISLSTLEHTIALSKSFTCPSACILTWYLTVVFQKVGLDLLAIINCSLSTRIFPSNFRHATVYPS